VQFHTYEIFGGIGYLLLNSEDAGNKSLQNGGTYHTLGTDTAEGYKINIHCCENHKPQMVMIITSNDNDNFTFN
jgi:hypothetical protein